MVRLLGPACAALVLRRSGGAATQGGALVQANTTVGRASGLAMEQINRTVADSCCGPNLGGPPPQKFSTSKGLDTAEGLDLNFYSQAHMDYFSAIGPTRWTSRHWEIPFFAVFLYVVSIPLLRAHVARRGKYDTRTFALWWNIFLAAFSMVGLSACLPVMLHELWHNGVDFTVCASASWYGHGWHGLWVAFFIYSKFFELVDTVLLLLAGRPVILLHWWHHSTVLLYCWHAYATTPGTGMWYATMNYGVHSIMYAYFAATQHSKRAREAVKPCAIYITLLQLLQMVVGITVTVRALLVRASGGECFLNKTNSILGLLMYFSYFVLFLKLFLDSYVYTKGKKAE